MLKDELELKPLSEYNLSRAERTDVMEMLKYGFELQEALDAVYDDSASRAERETTQGLRLAGAW